VKSLEKLKKLEVLYLRPPAGCWVAANRCEGSGEAREVGGAVSRVELQPHQGSD